MARCCVAVAVLVMFGCNSTPGPKGDVGATGPAGAVGAVGPRGEPGTPATNAALRWVDATGALVGDEALWVDDGGVQWPLDLETGGIGELTIARRSVLNRGFLAADCTGAEYLRVGVPPRVAVLVEDDVDSGVVMVRDDMTAVSNVDTHSFQFRDGGCLTVTRTILAVPVSTLRAVGPAPQTSFVGPLRREWR